jgi:hypothetical protein
MCFNPSGQLRSKGSYEVNREHQRDERCFNHAAHHEGCLNIWVSLYHNLGPKQVFEAHNIVQSGELRLDKTKQKLIVYKHTHTGRRVHVHTSRCSSSNANFHWNSSLHNDVCKFPLIQKHTYLILLKYTKHVIQPMHMMKLSYSMYCTNLLTQTHTQRARHTHTKGTHTHAFGQVRTNKCKLGCGGGMLDPSWSEMQSRYNQKSRSDLRWRISSEFSAVYLHFHF